MVILGEESQGQNPGRYAVPLVGGSPTHSSWCFLCPVAEVYWDLGYQGQGWL